MVRKISIVHPYSPFEVKGMVVKKKSTFLKN